MDAAPARTTSDPGTSEAEWNAWPGLARLPTVALRTLVPQGARAVVVAPHPDDEVLTIGGLLAQLAGVGAPVQVIAVTDGTASHRGSSEWPAERLVHERPGESRLALRRLGIDVEPIRLGMPDAGLRGLEFLLADRLLRLVARSDVLFTTWRHDGHPDHEATGDACAFTAARAGVKLVEVPVWGWHWAVPGDPRLPWRRARRLLLDADAVHRKRHAVQAFASQLEADRSTGAEPVLRPGMVERAARPFEVLFL